MRQSARLSEPSDVQADGDDPRQTQLSNLRKFMNQSSDKKQDHDDDDDDDDDIKIYEPKGKRPAAYDNFRDHQNLKRGDLDNS